MGEDSSLCKTASGRFRWLLFLRFMVALVVTVVAAVVLVRGLRLVLAPRPIKLDISQSNVFVHRHEVSNGSHYYFRFYLEATNPSELIFIYYRNITVQLFDTIPAPGPPSFSSKLLAEFNLTPTSLSLSQKEEQEFYAYGQTHNVTELAVKKLFTDEREAQIDGAAMVLSGVLTVYDFNRGGIATHHGMKYTCEPVAVKSNAPLPEPTSKNYKAPCLGTVS